MQTSPIIILIPAALTMFDVIGFLSLLAHYYTLNGIKSRTVGDGQHGTAIGRPSRKSKRPIPRCPTSWKNGAREKTFRKPRD